jgi:hypothetical protein
MMWLESTSGQWTHRTLHRQIVDWLIGSLVRLMRSQRNNQFSTPSTCIITVGHASRSFADPGFRAAIARQTLAKNDNFLTFGQGMLCRFKQVLQSRIVTLCG